MKQHHLVSFCQLLLVHRRNKNTVTVARFEKYCIWVADCSTLFPVNQWPALRTQLDSACLKTRSRIATHLWWKIPGTVWSKGHQPSPTWLLPELVFLPSFYKGNCDPTWWDRKPWLYLLVLIRNVCMCRVYGFYPVNRHYQAHFFQMFILL